MKRKVVAAQSSITQAPQPAKVLWGAYGDPGRGGGGYISRGGRPLPEMARRGWAGSVKERQGLPGGTVKSQVKGNRTLTKREKREKGNPRGN